MGTCTVLLDPDAFSPVDANAGFMVRAKLTMSGSYAAGGDSVTAAMFGLGELKLLNVLGGGAGSGAANGGIVLVPNPNGGYPTLVTAFEEDPTGVSKGPLVEVTAGVNLSGYTADVIAYGF